VVLAATAVAFAGAVLFAIVSGASMVMPATAPAPALMVTHDETAPSHADPACAPARPDVESRSSPALPRPPATVAREAPAQVSRRTTTLASYRSDPY
jgi:hypothetical protein